MKYIKRFNESKMSRIDVLENLPDFEKKISFDLIDLIDNGFEIKFDDSYSSLRIMLHSGHMEFSQLQDYVQTFLDYNLDKFYFSDNITLFKKEDSSCGIKIKDFYKDVDSEQDHINYSAISKSKLTNNTIISGIWFSILEKE